MQMVLGNDTVGELDRRSRREAEMLVASLPGRAARAPRLALDPVTTSAVRAWCEAMGEQSCCTTSSVLMQVAPAATLQVWTFPPVSPDRAVDGPSLPGDFDTELRRRLAQLGYPAALATKCDFEFEHPIEIGMTISATQHYTGSSVEKTTAIGRGFFVDSEATYQAHSGVILGRVRVSVFHFEPVSATTLQHPKQVLADEQHRSHGSPGEIAPGARFDRVEIPLTTTQIVAGALATRDLYPVHHDRDFARAHGSRDIVLNIQTTSGLLTRVVREWTGAKRLRTFKLRLRAPACANSVLGVDGCVSGLHEGIAQVTVTASTEDGCHAEALADVQLDEE
jgi:3-oxo-4,17-pregnadiene-20-carboxyl-CoA hydratase beta subunit